MIAVRILDHGRLVLANVLFPRWFQRLAEYVRTVVSEGAGYRLHGATRFRRRREATSRRGWRPRERRREPGDGWRRPARRAQEDVSIPNIS